MIQDIAPHQLHNGYDPAARPSPEDAALCFAEEKLLLQNGSIPTIAQLGEGKYRFLFTLDEQKFFLGTPKALPEGCAYTEVNALRRANLLPQHLVFAVLTGKHLSDWYRDNRFCGRCRSKMQHSETERAMKCPACGYTCYPRIMPAVIVGVIHGDSLLLTRYRTGYRHNALIAGFTEIGETAEQTVSREVMEEAGIRVKNIRYYKSQPWGIANDLLLGYFCELDGDPTIRMDEQELSVCRWVPRGEIQLQPDNFSLTNEMMRLFQDGGV